MSSERRPIQVDRMLCTLRRGFSSAVFQLEWRLAVSASCVSRHPVKIFLKYPKED